MTRRVSGFLAAALLVLPVLAGQACRKRNAAAPPAQGEIISQPGPATPSIAGKSEERIPTQEDVYQATRKFMERTKRPANTPEELVSAGLLAPLPGAPPGKKYVLDQRAANLRLVDR
ncbi:MAG: hypothetical protein HZA92_07315 [Verrucomicrobia bacterium]|nr:hypothetical protein [Verrucomicrobiota bacterium]